MSASGCFARVWGPRPHITYSEYFEDWEGGTYRDAVLCQNVERLTFADGSFDLVVSEDVFEHVRDCRRGFREIRRVLAPGGYHVFSVPIGFTHPTQERFETRGDQEVPRLPVEYHGDPIRGQIPVRTTFGYDLVDFLESLGFEASLEMSRYDEARRFGTFDCVTVVTRKP
jgi:SAM-dependent methyltransferase